MYSLVTCFLVSAPIFRSLPLFGALETSLDPWQYNTVEGAGWGAISSFWPVQEGDAERGREEGLVHPIVDTSHVDLLEKKEQMEVENLSTDSSKTTPELLLLGKLSCNPSAAHLPAGKPFTEKICWRN